MIATKTQDKYFTDIADKVILNRCPHCNIGMPIDTPTLRRCNICGYTDTTNIPFKVKLKIGIYQMVHEKEVTLIAFENDKAFVKYPKVSFIKKFQDIYTAERYKALIDPICL